MASSRLQNVKASATLAVSAKAKELTAAGKSIVDFSVGEPDFPTPDRIKAAADRALRENFTRYTASAGIPELRKAICEKLRADNGLHYEPSEIIVSTGAKQCLYNAVMALFQEGDEVLIPTPCWVSYAPQVHMAGAKPVFVPASEENGFRMLPAEIRAKITRQTKGLILNSPSNPTGAAYSREELAELAEVLAEHDTFVIADEIYEKLVYDNFKFTSFASLGSKWKDRCLVVNGFSKAYAMTGWRIGYAAGPRDLVRAMCTIQDHSTSNANAISQKAGLEALTGPQDEVERMRQAFERRRDLMHAHLAAIPGVLCRRPQGAFYLLPNWQSYLGRSTGEKVIATSVDLATYFIEEAHVAVVPGEGFEAPGYLRFSYATSEELIEEGLRRVATAAARLRVPAGVQGT